MFYNENMTCKWKYAVSDSFVRNAISSNQTPMKSKIATVIAIQLLCPKQFGGMALENSCLSLHHGSKTTKYPNNPEPFLIATQSPAYGPIR